MTFVSMSANIVWVFSLENGRGNASSCFEVQPWIALVSTLIWYSLGFLHLFPILSGYSLFRLMPFLILLRSFLRSLRSLVILPSSFASYSLAAHPNCRSSKFKLILGENSRGTVTLSTTSWWHCKYIKIQHINGRHIQSQ